jgi:hypothetical protein
MRAEALEFGADTQEGIVDAAVDAVVQKVEINGNQHGQDAGNGQDGAPGQAVCLMHRICLVRPAV